MLNLATPSVGGGQCSLSEAWEGAPLELKGLRLDSGPLVSKVFGSISQAQLGLCGAEAPDSPAPAPGELELRRRRGQHPQPHSWQPPPPSRMEVQGPVQKAGPRASKAATPKPSPLLCGTATCHGFICYFNTIIKKKYLKLCTSRVLQRNSSNRVDAGSEEPAHVEVEAKPKSCRRQPGAQESRSRKFLPKFKG